MGCTPTRQETMDGLHLWWYAPIPPFLLLTPSPPSISSLPSLCSPLPSLHPNTHLCRNYIPIQGPKLWVLARPVPWYLKLPSTGAMCRAFACPSKGLSKKTNSFFTKETSKTFQPFQTTVFGLFGNNCCLRGLERFVVWNGWKVLESPSPLHFTLTFSPIPQETMPNLKLMHTEAHIPEMVDALRTSALTVHGVEYEIEQFVVSCVMHCV